MIVWPAARVKASVQPLTAVVPVLVMVMLLVRPVFHALTALVTRQVLVPPGLVVGDVVGLVVGGVVTGGVVGLVVGGVVTGVVVGVLPPTPLMMASMMPCWVTVAELRS